MIWGAETGSTLSVQIFNQFFLDRVECFNQKRINSWHSFSKLQKESLESQKT
jgi:hypothetical protein